MLDNKAISLLLFVDFKKALDRVDSKLLLIKLLSYGLSNKTLELIRNYFFCAQSSYAFRKRNIAKCFT